MKKLSAIILVLALSVMLFGCKPTEKDPLAYQTYPFTAKGSLTANDTEYVFSVTMTDKGQGKVEFSQPDGLRGYLFTVTPEGITLSYGDMTIDFSTNGEKTNAVKLIADLFSLDSSTFVSASDLTQNSVELTVAEYKVGQTPTKVYINKATGSPMRFEFGSTVIDITEFTQLANPAGTQQPPPSTLPPTHPSDTAIQGN